MKDLKDGEEKKEKKFWKWKGTDNVFSESKIQEVTEIEEEEDEEKAIEEEGKTQEYNEGNFPKTTQLISKEEEEEEKVGKGQQILEFNHPQRPFEPSNSNSLKEKNLEFFEHFEQFSPSRSNSYSESNDKIYEWREDEVILDFTKFGKGKSFRSITQTFPEHREKVFFFFFSFFFFLFSSLFQFDVNLMLIK